MGKLRAVENERREHSNEQSVAPEAEREFQQQPRVPAEPPSPEFAPDSGPAASDEGPVEDRAEANDPSVSAPEAADTPPPETGTSSAVRGRRRGRRPPPRDRRTRGRGGRHDRERRPGHFQTAQHAHHAHHPSAAEDQESRREYPEQGAGKGSLLHEIRSEVDRIQEVLESVLRDLDHVSEQLTKAEHEKDLSEAEIEQLKESLRRLHR